MQTDDAALFRDAVLPTTMPFATALGSLAGEFNLLSLRTCKADVCVGLEQGVEERCEAEDKNWRVGGKYILPFFSFCMILGLMRLIDMR